ncbi:DUF2283 domain-containing protein [Oscillatoria sp. CS-180]|uniref:DUF2283 domain-containing protein n=1 Tax=Oscillatoria sp. CS-180 TaxID=3021720 RepID=UPI00232C1787|nr:DUF2283 domain-containing protein [Oscillatoria sp. CS-180]MDB9527033.1 DUF2283 domain-containing protein [Oscillatoria sp. CS-180]
MSLTFKLTSKVYDAEADVLIFVMKDVSPSNAIAEPGSIVVSYDENSEPISIEFLNASQRQLFNPNETNLTVLR